MLNIDKMDVDSTESTAPGGIDEGLYNRQLYVLGHEAMKKMRNADVLLIGLRGLGVEIAKNIILTGVKSVTLSDDEPTTLFDLSSQFYLSEKDIGTSRAQACLSKLTDLNSYVPVSVHKGEITESFLKNFKVVLMTDQPLDFQLRVNKFCHSNKIAFISSDIRGVFANIFCDFGPKFVVQDTNGEQPSSIIISSITQENPGIVTTVDDKRLPFEDDDYVTFSDVQGMTELNEMKPIKIKRLGPYTFSICDTTKFSPYKTGGFAVQEKMPATLNFLSLEESLENPEFLFSDFAKMDRPEQLHLGFQALHQFKKAHGSFPASHDEKHANEIISICKSMNEKKKRVEKIDENLIKTLAHCASGDLAAMVAFIGGVAAQEVLKAVSAKFTPIKQWLYFDATEILPSGDLPPSEFQPIGSRYDAQIIVLGKTLQEKIHSLNYFLVGSGAIGCEVLKIWAMMGVGTKGMIHVTDMDIIEKSNLSRQFLFRPKDVEELKSKTAANAVKHMNPEINVTAYSLRVGTETENIFNESFYQSLNGVCNALDNVEARLYMDGQCIFYKKPLLESGTLGTKGNTQVIVPHMTESYGSSRDPPEKSIPICTLHHFPNVIEHTIQWARDIFEGLYKNQSENVNSYLTNPTFLEGLQKQNPAVKLETLSSIKSCLVDDKPTSFEQCISWARLKFEEYFNNNIQQLLYNFPVDMITSSGAPFWSGPKRAPKPIIFNESNPLHLEFILSAANLRAFNYGIKGTWDLTVVKKYLPNIMVPDFTPKKVKINTEPEAENSGEQNAPPSEDVDEETSKKIINSLPSPQNVGGFKMVPIDFEKDDDKNFHMDFITAAANLRASNYSIPLADKHKCKGIAGKIIPAMITTTAVVSGLVCLELIKTLQQKKIEDYKNGFVNLALPFFGFSEPIKPPTTKIRDGWEWSLWDRFEVEGDLTLQQFFDHFKQKYQLEVTMISCGVSMLYSFFMNKQKVSERINQRMSQLVATVSKQALPEGKLFLVLEVCCNRLEDEEEVDVPSVKIHLTS